MQEYKNQILSATEASKIQRLERAGEAQAEAQRLAGAETARSLDYRKTTTQLGMSQQELAAANQAIATAEQSLHHHKKIIIWQKKDYHMDQKRF